MQLSQLLSVVLLGVSAVAAQTNNTDGTDGSVSANGTIFDLLTAPNNTLGVSSFVNLLSSDPSYQSVIDELKSSDNLTCFIPNNKVMAQVTKDYKQYAKHHGLNASNAFPPANLTIGNVSVLDVVKYHCVNGSFALTNLTDYVTLLNTTSNATDVDPLGYGLPLLVTNNATWEHFNNETWLNESRPYLTYQVGNGTRKINVSKKDIKASNGYLDVIDGVLTPPVDPNNTITHYDGTKTFAKVLAKNPEVADYLNGLENFTLFAPSDEAFKRFAYSSLKNDTAKTFVLSHIINGTFTSADFPQGNSTLTNFNNQSIPLFVNGTYIKLNNTAVVDRQRNILFNNGILHVISKVLNPPTNATENSTNGTDAVNATST